MTATRELTKSVAFQQVKGEMSGPPTLASRRHFASGALQHILSSHGLLVFGLLLIALYAVLLPDTFVSTQTFRAVMGASVIVTFLALAEMIVIASGNYDLSVAYGIGFFHIVAMGMLVDLSVPWPLVVILTVLLGAFAGLVNGLLVEFAKIDSFIATLGVGTILYGFGAWYTNGAQIVGNIPRRSRRSTTLRCSAFRFRRFSSFWSCSCSGWASSICRSATAFMRLEATARPPN